MLLQKRAMKKYHSPGLWTNTVCTHPYPGESNKDAVIRRLKQELGLAVKDVTKLFHFTYNEKLDNELTEYEFDHVFIGVSDDLPVPEPNEVMDFKYIGMHEVLEQVKKSPQDYTVWFKKIVERVALDVKNFQ
jgi:isopentenyl-diphosphate delta-isomerase